MANWTDCTMKFFSEDEKILRKIEKEAQEKEFCDYQIIDGDETELYFNCSGRWNADYEWFKDTCIKHSVEGRLIDAEAGCDFYVTIEVDEEGATSENEYNYLCDASIAEYGEEYFIEYYCDTFDTPEDADYVLDALKLMGEEREDAMRYIVNDPRYCVKPSAELQQRIDSLFEGAPKIGTTDGNSKVRCKIDDLLIIEAEPNKNGYITTSYNLKEEQWQEREIILGDIELAKVIQLNEELNGLIIDDNGKVA